MLKTVNGTGIVAGVLFVTMIAGVALPAVAVYDTPLLNEPANGAVVTGDSVVLKWFFVENTQYYFLQIAYDASFTQIVANVYGISNARNTYTFTDLPQNETVFYWRVKATVYNDNSGSANDSDWSDAWSFTSNGNAEGEAGTLNPPILKSAPEDGATLEDTGRVVLEVSWYLLDDYEHVFYQIARDEAFTMILEEYETRSLSFGYSCYENGTYFWRIRRENDDGAYSDWITRSFTAKIVEEVHSPQKLTIYVTPENSGEVIADPEMPSEGYPYETSVTLTAIAKQGFKFLQWDRSDSSTPTTSSILKFSIDRDTTISAVFEATQGGDEGEDAEGEPATPGTTAAEFLQEQFNDADTDTDGLLTFEEALEVLDSLTQAQFDAFDTNSDSFLSQEELEAYLEPSSGCFGNCRKTKSTADYVKQMIGDWLLLGLSLTVLLFMANR